MESCINNFDSEDTKRDMIKQTPNLDIKYINQEIKDFSELYSKKYKELEIKVWILEKIFPTFQKNDFACLQVIEKTVDHIQKFKYENVSDKISLLYKYTDELISILDVISQKPENYWDLDVFDERFSIVYDKISNIFNYTDYNYVDLDLYSLEYGNILKYIKNNPPNDITYKLLYKLKDMKPIDYKDLIGKIMVFDSNFQWDNRYDYIFENLLESNKSYFKTVWDVFLMRILKSIKNIKRAEIIKDFFEKDERLCLLLIESSFLLSNIDPDWSLYSHNIKSLDDYLVLNTIDQNNKDKIIDIINKYVKESDRKRLIDKI